MNYAGGPSCHFIDVYPTDARAWRSTVGASRSERPTRPHPRRARSSISPESSSPATSSTEWQTNSNSHSRANPQAHSCSTQERSSYVAVLPRRRTPHRARSFTPATQGATLVYCRDKTLGNRSGPRFSDQRIRVLTWPGPPSSGGSCARPTAFDCRVPDEVFRGYRNESNSPTLCDNRLLTRTSCGRCLRISPFARGVR